MTTPLPIPGTLLELADANTIAGSFGQTLTEPEISLAELVIAIRTGVPISDADTVAAMDATDLYWLRQAIVFQAIWQKGQPDLLARLDVSQTSTDGDSITMNHDGLMLAPMAKWAILRTTLMTWQTAHVQPTQGMLGSGAPTDLENIGFSRWGARYFR